MMFRNALAFTLALVACNSIAASFDCSKAANFAESSICNDGYLSGVDSILARSYQKALAETEHPDELRQSQREWLSVRDQCTTQKCLDQTLGARVTFLDSYSRVEKSKAYAAEEKLRKDEYEAQRQAEDLANSQRDQQYRIAQEQFRQQKQQSAQPHQVAQTQSQSVQPAPSSQSPANVVSAQQVRPAQPVAGKPAVLRAHVAGLLGRPDMEIHALDRIFDHLPGDLETPHRGCHDLHRLHRCCDHECAARDRSGCGSDPSLA